ncbi:MAG: efflux RND transporter periplasmic adaptor subunit [Acidobacteria bacterium]|nr:efflux RND transporter periplasmic adaptor subunit [Acidobacteriota bacterium]
MKTLLGAIVVAAVLAGGFISGIWYARRGVTGAAKNGRKVLYWMDPMHPAYKSDKPGIAPDCGMKLEPVYEEGPAPAAESRKVLRYQDPQDPKYTSEKPGINPETGNDLVPVYEGSAESMPAGTINVSVEKQQTIGVKFATVEGAAGAETIRANGRVAQDETKVTRVHPKVDGWIHKVDVDFTGQLVKAGDPLLTIYSPDMLASEQEFLLALRARDSMKSSPSPEAYENSEILIEAARRRLELWDLSAAQISELERTRKPIRTVTLYSPAAGYVMSRNAFPSQRVTPETELYAISDLSRVWIMADVFESDIPKVRLGQAATITQAFAGGISIPAKVTYIQPQVDPATRTLKVRLEAANANTRLKPDMFVVVEFRLALDGRLTVPADAVVNTGLRKTVFVDRGNGYLEPRGVETGERIGERVQVNSGLRAGERVVSSGAFLIDSEAQLKSPGGSHD